MRTEPTTDTTTVDAPAADNGDRQSRRSEQRPRDGTSVGFGGRPVRVPVEALLPANDSPRLEGENCEHARALAESDAAVPPILVHRSSCRVLDGMHRLHAAILRGATEIEVIYFDGSEEDAFVAAVKANITHGLPLSRSDRRAAATRIVKSHPHWSDRAIAEVTGLAARTIAEIRRSSDDIPQLDTRTGRDGRARPLDGQAIRRRVGDMITKHPDASLRKIALAAGVSPTTVRNVRERMRRGEDPTAPASPRPPAAADKPPNERAVAGRQCRPPDPTSILRNLRTDPSLRYTEAGRSLIRFFDLQLSGLAECRRSVETAPLHCRYALIEFAQAVAERWMGFAEELKQHTDVDEPETPAGQ